MSFIMMAKAMKIKTGSPARKLVLLKLADDVNDSGECSPSYQYIAEQCEMSRRATINHINALIELGLVAKITRKSPANPASNISNTFRLTLDDEDVEQEGGCHA